MLERTLQPAFSNDFRIPSLQHQSFKTSHGVPVFLFKAGSENVLKMEFVFNAGHIQAGNGNIAGACNVLMREGTKHRNAKEISEALDYYGSYYENEASRDRASVCLYSLSKHVKNTLPVLLEVLNEPSFPEKEVQLYKDNLTQKLRVNMKKIDFVARQKFPSLIFGEEHPYGIQQSEQGIAEIQKEKLQEIHQRLYLNGIRYIIISGNLGSEEESWLMNVLLNLEMKPLFGGSLAKPVIQPAQKKFILLDDAIQSALRIGRTVADRNHEDYPGLQVMNTILGGHFGSRLMSNIREDKGYTYGIGSGITPLLNATLFTISTEVGKEVTRDALREIYAEMQRLRTEAVEAEELELVKNYMMGTFLRSMDGPFQLAERFSSLLDFSLPENWFHLYLDKVRHISSEDVLRLADKYLNPSDFTELVVGSEQ
jgi:predicted Zn-dependent peptidase